MAPTRDDDIEARNEDSGGRAPLNDPPPRGGGGTAVRSLLIIGGLCLALVCGWVLYLGLSLSGGYPSAPNLATQEAHNKANSVAERFLANLKADRVDQAYRETTN